MENTDARRGMVVLGGREVTQTAVLLGAEGVGALPFLSALLVVLVEVEAVGRSEELVV